MMRADVVPPAVARRFGIATAAAALAVDQGTKHLALFALSPGEALPITPFFNLRLSFNEGVSFGLFADWFAGRPLVLAALTLVMTMFLVWLLFRASSRWEAAAIGMIIGGGLGNIMDRVGRSAVVDFLDLHAIGHHWPTFNLADVAIVLGAAMICVVALLAPATSKP
jgi:signal peptidase II